MDIMLIIAGLAALLIFIILAIALPAARLKQAGFKKTGKHPKGHYLGMGIALGIPLGLPIGLALGNIALGPAMGLPIGLAIGAALEKKHENELRPLTPEEEMLKKKSITILLITLTLGVLAAALFMARMF